MSADTRPVLFVMALLEPLPDGGADVTWKWTLTRHGLVRDRGVITGGDLPSWVADRSYAANKRMLQAARRSLLKSARDGEFGSDVPMVYVGAESRRMRLR